MRVLHLFSGMGAGGAEKMTLSLCKELEANGVYSAVVCPAKSYLHGMCVDMGIRHRLIRFTGTFDFLHLISLLRLIRKDRITILHAHQGKVFWPCIYAKWLTGGKVRVVFHRRVAMPHHYYSRRHYRHADGVVAISAAVARVLAQRDGVDPAKIRVVYNGCDFSRFDARIDGAGVRRRYGIGDAAVVVGTVGAMNLPKGKGQGYLVEAMAILKDEYPNLVCLIVGTGPFESELKRLAAAAGVSDRVIFAGFQESVESFMAAMDIFTLNSWDTEGFGQVMVEAQALGKPVVGTDIGGIGETFADNRTGLLIPPENPLVLAAALRHLLNKPQERAAMGAAGARFVREKFTIRAMVEGVTRVYRECLARDAGPAPR
jgi:glycosyltransferase involved in cell wall biosynthesis